MTAREFLIVEEALKDRSGHWFEYNRAVKNVFSSLTDINVSMLGHVELEQDVAVELGVIPWFRYTVWDQIYDHPQAWRRYLGVILHNTRFYSDLRRYLVKMKRIDFIFAPTVVLHHLVAYQLIATLDGGKNIGQLILLIRNNIAVYDQNGNRRFKKSAIAWKWAIQRFKRLIDLGVVSFVTDSERLADEYEALTGIRFRVVPHPSLIGLAANRTDDRLRILEEKEDTRVFLPGPARYEKGTDRLVELARQLNDDPSVPRIKFVVQWSETFDLPSGRQIGPIELENLRFEKITFLIHKKPLSSAEYATELNSADIILLPYRIEAYYARISGVAVEVMLLGKPLVYTENTWVASVASKFGYGLSTSEDAADLCKQLKRVVVDLEAFSAGAMKSKRLARIEYSSENFLRKLLV